VTMVAKKSSLIITARDGNQVMRSQPSVR
jgi:hypothetical protein